MRSLSTVGTARLAALIALTAVTCLQGAREPQSTRDLGGGSILEFTLPTPSAGAGSRSTIVGFLVGYFDPKAEQPRWSFLVKGNDVKGAGGTVRIPLKAWKVDPGREYVIRVKTISAAGNESAWSAPTTPIVISDPAMFWPQRTQQAPSGAKPPPDRVRGRAARAGAPKAKREIGRLIADTPPLARAVAELLPDGVSIEESASGFANLQQFLATAYVSHNLKVPFEAVKKRLIGPPRVSLGRAVRELRPAADVRAEVRRAQQQARVLARQAHSEPRQ